MNVKLYNAVITQLRADAMKHLAELESLMASPVNENSVENAVEKAQKLVQSEGAIHTLQQYFQPRPPAPKAAPAPDPQAPAKAPATPPKKITEEMSPSYKKSIAAEEKRLKAQEARIKREKAAAKRKKETKDE